MQAVTVLFNEIIRKMVKDLRDKGQNFSSGQKTSLIHPPPRHQSPDGRCKSNEKLMLSLL